MHVFQAPNNASLSETTHKSDWDTVFLSATDYTPRKSKENASYRMQHLVGDNYNEPLLHFAHKHITHSSFYHV
jgi:hypothetical protein